jgi:peptide/nickel transport system ATP-binding protein
MTASTQNRPGVLLDQQTDRGGKAQPMLIAKGLQRYFPIRGGILNRRVAEVKAVDGVSFTVLKGETLGVVGESGCGKSTLARLLMHLLTRDAGELVFDGDPVGVPNGLPLRELRRNMQMVFQDSYSSLNPRMPVEESIAYAPRVHGMERAQAKETARELLRRVGLQPEHFAGRYPHELSGGQKQRVNIARALALGPRMLILDEAVSALDKSVEAQVLNLLGQLKREFDLTYIFISHDLHVVQYVADRVLVMYLGQVVELGPVAAIYEAPRHPYTAALLACRLTVDPAERIDTPPLVGDPPNPINPPSGCRFRPRCPYAEPVCEAKMPMLGASITDLPGSDLGGPWNPDAGGHLVACHMAHAGSGHSKAAPAGAVH